MKIVTVFVLIFTTHCNSAKESDVDKINWRYYNGYPVTSFNKIVTLKTFSARSRTVIYIHGYEESPSSFTARVIALAHLKWRPSDNFVLLDWSKLASASYLDNAATNTERVGRVAGYHLLSAIAIGLKRESVHVVGFSLGCHVAASLGRTTQIYGLTIPRITGLDCALPGFLPSLAGLRLNPSSASFVDVIHTDSGMLGQPISLGHADFWPNGGTRQQPGCITKSIYETITSSTLRHEFCSHERACVLFAESVKYPENFAATECSNYSAFNNSLCNSKSKAFMGYNVSILAKGNYYLSTGDKFPYGKRK